MINREPGQDGNVAALNYLPLCGGFIIMRMNDEFLMKEALAEARHQTR